MKPYRKRITPRQRDVPEPSRLELLILAALASQERYGLEIVESIKEVSQGLKSVSLGSLYTTLHRMERKGLVTARWGDTSEVRQGARRRYYRITALGERALTVSKAILVSTLRLAGDAVTN